MPRLQAADCPIQTKGLTANIPLQPMLEARGYQGDSHILVRASEGREVPDRLHKQIGVIAGEDSAKKRVHLNQSDQQ